jgi:hypothetical protein
MNRNRKELSALLGLAVSILQGLSSNANAAEKAAPLATFGKLPIKELTVFKDGHACVAHEGEMPTDDQGNVVMDYLPAPVIGAFWPYSADKRARLASVVAGQKRVLVERTALNLRELLEANRGVEALITESGGQRYQATVIGLPARSGEELAATSPPNTPERLPEKGNLVLLKTPEGVKAIALDRIQEVVFIGAHKAAAPIEEFRDLLTLRLDWGKAKSSPSAKVGLFYVQKGVRWIPSYKIEIDGQSNATVKLQATLINELADLEDVSVNLVVGVPTFAFKDTIDPIALQQNLAHLSQYFQGAGGSFYNSPIASQFSNSIMSQSARMGESPGGFASAGAGFLGPDIGAADKSEDLFVFTVPHVTLKRGERMVMPVAEFTLPYKDVFTLDIPFAPPPELRGNLNNDQQRELARLFNAPKVMHKLRLTNNSRYPLTTAPALIVREGRVLAQGMMTYTSTGATVDLPITAAVDFQVKRSATETKRTPDALRQNGSTFSRIDLKGQITITSHRAQPAELEVTRSVLGFPDTADHDGKVERLGVFEGGDYLAGTDYPEWWSWYGWPSWWTRCNGTGRFTWRLSLAPKQTADLGCEWHYFWQ